MVHEPPRAADSSELGIATVWLSPGSVLGGDEAVAVDLNAALAPVLSGTFTGRGHKLRFVYASVRNRSLRRFGIGFGRFHRRNQAFEPVSGVSPRRRVSPT
jgi:hypothetical protein